MGIFGDLDVQVKVAASFLILGVDPALIAIPKTYLSRGRLKEAKRGHEERRYIHLDARRWFPVVVDEIGQVSSS